MLFTDEEADMALWTETWLTPGDQDIIAEFKRANYQFSHVDRKEKTGGGIALMTKSNYKIELKHHEQSLTMEHAMWKITINKENIYIISIYRPPSNTILQSTAKFIDEFATLMEGYLDKYRPLLVMGDFNIHWNKENNIDAQHLKDTAMMLNLTQWVTCPTHKSGNTIDLIFTSIYDKIVLNNPKKIWEISDHDILRTELFAIKPSYEKKEIKYRKKKDINKQAIRMDIEQMSKNAKEVDDLELVSYYNRCMMEIYNKHMPLITKRIWVKSKRQWFTAEINTIRKTVRKAERNWRKNENAENRRIYRDLLKGYRKAIRKIKYTYMNEQLKKYENPSDVYEVFNRLVG